MRVAFFFITICAASDSDGMEVHMKHSTEQGLTLLEVILAISIFMMGVGFIIKSDAVSYKYFDKGQVRQQMMFYAAGLLEAEIEGISPPVSVDFEPFSNFHAVIDTSGTDDNVNRFMNLEKVEVTVSLTSSPTATESVSLFTYRVRR